MYQKLLKAIKNPAKVFRFIITIIKSNWYILWYGRVLNKASFGRGFRSAGTLSIKGPGKVVFGDNVHIGAGMTATPWTCTPSAEIIIGDGTFLNGTRFACASKIILGKRCIMADCRIMDTDFHGTDPDNRERVLTAPITIGDNVWITIQSIVLKGVTIGYGTTITPNSVVSKNIPQRVIAGGNPVQVIKEL